MLLLRDGCRLSAAHLTLGEPEPAEQAGGLYSHLAVATRKVAVFSAWVVSEST